MKDEDLTKWLIIGIGAFVVYNIVKKELFQPEGMTQTGLSNTADRAGTTNYRGTDNDRTYVRVGSTTYSIRDTDLSQTGYIRRRAWLGSVTGLDNFDWFNNWVYS